MSIAHSPPENTAIFNAVNESAIGIDVHADLYVGCDHDGFDDVDSLKRLINELVTMSQNARTCMREGKLFSNLSESPEEK